MAQLGKGQTVGGKGAGAHPGAGEFDVPTGQMTPPEGQRAQQAHRRDPCSEGEAAIRAAATPAR